jgi:cysteine protease ATG4
MPFSRALVSDFPEANMAVYIATDGVVYRKDVYDVATGKKPRGDFGYLTTRTHTDMEREEARKIYNQSTGDPQRTPTPPAQQQQGDGDSPVFKPTLLLIAIRLGIDSLHRSYYPALKVRSHFSSLALIVY